MQSVFILLVMLLNKRLPWYQPRKLQNKTILELLKLRAKKSTEQLFLELVPDEIRDCLTSVFQLKFQDEPDYDSILSSLWKCFEDAVLSQNPAYDERGPSMNEIDPVKNHTFEWNLNAASRFKNSLVENEN